MKATLFNYILLLGLVSGCEMVRDVHADHDPVIQVDGYFVEGEKPSEIRIRNTFSTTISGERTIPASEIWLTPQTIAVWRNGNPQTIKSVAAGRFVLSDSTIVMAGDAFHIEIEDHGRKVKATARVGTFQKPELADFTINRVSTPEIKEFRRNVHPYKIDTHWVAQYDLSFKLPVQGSFFMISGASELERAINEMYFTPRSWYNAFDPLTGKQFFSAFEIIQQSKLPNPERLDFKRIANVSISYGPNLVLPNSVKIICEVIIPEAIYESWWLFESSSIVPITVTNVEGGVGLFIGAQKFKWEVSVPYN
jgi:hypothetical protein